MANLQGHMENFNREIETIGKYKIKIPEIKL